MNTSKTGSAIETAWKLTQTLVCVLALSHPTLTSLAWAEGEEGGGEGGEHSSSNSEDGASKHEEALKASQADAEVPGGLDGMLGNVNVNTKSGAVNGMAGGAISSAGNIMTVGKAMAERGVGGALGIGVMTISQLKDAHQKECVTDLNRVSGSQGGVNVSGNLDAAALGQKVPLCQLVKDAIKTAEAERAFAITYGTVSAVCGVACAIGKTPYGAWANPVCSYTDLAAGVGVAIAEGVLQGSMQAGLQGAVSKIKDSEIGKKMGDKLMEKAGNIKFKGTALKDTKLGQKAGLGKAGGEKAQKSQDEQRQESCQTMAMAIFETLKHTTKNAGARTVGSDTLKSILAIRNENKGGGTSMQLAATKISATSVQAVNAAKSNASGSAGGQQTQANMDAMYSPCGGGTGASAMLSCAMASDSHIPKAFGDPNFQAQMESRFPGWMDRPMDSPEDATRLIGELSGLGVANMEPVVAAVNASMSTPAVVAAMKASGVSYSPSTPTYSQSTENRSPASEEPSEEKSLEQMMKDLLGGNGKDKEEPQGPSFEAELKFRYSKDPAAIAEDPRVSIFKRVSYRYREIDQRAGFRIPSSTQVGTAPSAGGMR